MLGPFKILRRLYMASLLFVSLISLPMDSELAIKANKRRNMLSKVSSSLHVRYSKIAFKPFYSMKISLMSSLKLQRFTKADADRDAKLKLLVFIV